MDDYEHVLERQRPYILMIAWAIVLLNWSSHLLFRLIVSAQQNYHYNLLSFLFDANYYLLSNHSQSFFSFYCSAQEALHLVRIHERPAFQWNESYKLLALIPNHK